ncbi:MAG: hypothetical protein KJ879_02260, partial [Nanoarchaeota archaeon]|nr:hypothetical protein [Nanoarchaeota archaeon]
MKLKDVGLKRLTTGVIIFGIIIGLTAPALELYNFLSRSNRVVVAAEVSLLAFFLAQALIIENGKKWKYVILVGSPVLLAEIFARIFGLYQKIPSFGYFGHFWIGIALTYALIVIYKKRLKFIILFNAGVA